MNEVEPSIASLKKTVSDLSAQATERFTEQVKREPAKTLSLILAGSVLVSLVIGYSVSRMEQETRRQRLVEDWMWEVTNWIRENGWKIAGPLEEGVKATKSSVEDLSKSTAKRWLPFLEKQKRSLSNLF